MQDALTNAPSPRSRVVLPKTNSRSTSNEVKHFIFQLMYNIYVDYLLFTYLLHGAESFLRS